MNRSSSATTATVSSVDPLGRSRLDNPGFTKDPARQSDKQSQNIKKTIMSAFPTVGASLKGGVLYDDSGDDEREASVLNERVESKQKKLKEIEDKTTEDIEKIKHGVEEEITKGQKKIEASKATHATKSKNEELEKQGVEAKDNIADLRKQNKKLRDDSRDLPRQIQELMAHNKALIESNEAFGNAKKELQENVDSDTADNDKLEEILPQYRAKIDEYEESLESRSDLGEVENKIKKLYCDFNTKLIEMVKQKSDERELVEAVRAIEEEEAAPEGSAAAAPKNVSSAEQNAP